MINEISTSVNEIYEFDLTEIGLEDHILNIDEDGIYIVNKEFRFFITNAFMNDSLSIEEEDNECPPIIVTPEQRDLIISSIKEIAGLYKDNTN